MTPEELAAKIAELEAKNTALEASSNAKIAEFEAKLNPPTPDPDEKYKPATWKDLDDKVDQKAEAAALKVLQDAEEKKEKERKKQEDELQEQNKKIEEAFKKLEEEGIIEKTENVNDVGGQQRRQILGSLVRSGGQHVDIEARKLKSAWDQGLEYDHENNSFRRAGTAPSANRYAIVGSSANRTPVAPQKGPINLVGVRGDLDEAERRWIAGNGKV